MATLTDIWRKAIAFVARSAASFSFVGLVVGTLCFAASLTPSLLPRHFAVQGALSGLAFAVGYGVGRGLVLVWLLFQIPAPGARVQRVCKGSMAIVAAGIAVAFLSQTTRWQNSIRELMEMEPEATAYPFRVALIALVTGRLLIFVAQCVRWFWRMVNRRVERLVPPRVAFVTTTVLVATLLVLVLNNVFAKFLLRTADRAFLNLDRLDDGEGAIPADPLASGSAASLIGWDTIGRRGQDFVATGPTQSDIAAFLGRPAKRPLRVYAGYRSIEDVDARARLALDELKRVGGFDRSVLVVATPTGTGWLDPAAVDTVEYLHAGDTAIVSMGYSYLPSWMTILVDPDRSRASARALFAVVYEYWKTLPKSGRPRLYLHGLSLGSLGSESSADLYTLIEDPIQGGVFSGPPFPSTTWARITRDRNPGSPSWLPTFRDGAIVRFTGRRNTLAESGTRWGPIRFVYIQHASDPMVFFSPDLLYKEPAWLTNPRGPDVSPALRWYPIVTSLQIGFDLSVSTSVPLGYGHNYDPASYTDAWIAATDPQNWTPDQTRRLKSHFTGRIQGPSLTSP